MVRTKTREITFNISISIAKSKLIRYQKDLIFSSLPSTYKIRPNFHSAKKYQLLSPQHL